MAGPPCRCENCGNLFTTNQFEIGPGVSGVSFVGCGVHCPRCGAMARVGDGTYDSVEDVLKLVAGPASTRTLVDHLDRIAKSAREEKLTAEEVLAEIADVSPELAKKLRGIGKWPSVGLVLLLFWIVKSCTLDLTVDFNWLIDQAWHMGHGEDPDQHLKSDPPQFPFDPPPSKPADPFGNMVLAQSTPNVQNRRARRRASSISGVKRTKPMGDRR